MNWKKFLKITGISVAALFTLLLLLPFAFKGKIVKAVQTAANDNLNATVSFNSDFSLSLIRNFPNLSLGIQDLRIVGKDSFSNDTLIYAPQTKLVLDLASVWKGNAIIIRKIALIDARTKVIFLKSGAANFDIAKADTSVKPTVPEAESAPMALKINELSIENTRIYYVDHSLDFELITNGTNLNSSGDFADALFTLSNKIDIDKLTMNFGGMTLLSDAKIIGNTAINMDMNKMRFGFADNALTINDLPLNVKGWMELREKDIDMDIDIRTPSSEFKSFLSIVPGCYTKDFSDVKASGNLSLAFAMKGIMDDLRMPSTHVELKIANAGFQYPGMPASASNIALNFALDNTDGNPDNTHIVVAPFKANLGGDNIAISLDMRTPVSNPYAKGDINVQVNLDHWKKLIPLSQGTSLSGEIAADFDFEGHYSSIAKEQYNDLKAGGNVSLKNIDYSAPESLPLKMQSLELNVSPSNFKINAQALKFGKSSLDMHGELQNMLGYYLNDETLAGQLIINSKSIDLNEWMSAFAEAPATPTENVTPKVETAEANAGETAIAAPPSNASNAPHIPENLNLLFNMNVGQLLYEDYNMQQATAKAEVKNGVLKVNPLSAFVFGAKMEISQMQYSYPIGGKPTFSTGFNVLNANPANLATTLSIIKEYAPIVGRIQGLANLETQMGLQFKPNMDMDLSTLKAGGLFNLFSGNLDIPKWMGEAAKQLQWGADSKMALKPTKAGFLIENGQFKLKDSVGVALPKEGSMKFGGYVDLNKQLHLGGNIIAKGKKLPFTITGDVKSPKMTVNWKGVLKEASAPLINKVKDKAFDELNKKVAEILAQAKEKSDQLRAAGKETAAKIVKESQDLATKQKEETDKAYNLAMEKARKEADALVAAAKDPIQKKLAKVAADKLLKEAEKKATQAKNEGYKIADQTELKGKQKASQIESEANEKADQIELAAKTKTDEMVKQATTKANSVTK